MFENLKREMHGLLDDIRDIIEDEDEAEYFINRVAKLYAVTIDEIGCMAGVEPKEREQIYGEAELQRLMEEVDHLDDAFYSNEDFLVECPYCGEIFETAVEEDDEEVVCIECGNTIELDWDDDPYSNVLPFWYDDEDDWYEEDDDDDEEEDEENEEKD